MLDILKLLDKSNCRECGYPTCMAFAVSVQQGGAALSKCTHLDEETVAEHGGAGPATTPVDGAERYLEDLRKEIRSIDLEAAARRIGAPFSGDRVTVSCLGKPFAVDWRGEIHADIHVNSWIAVPVFSYILQGGAVEPEGEWITFRDLPGGMGRYPLFQRRCERPCKELADANPDFFDMLMRLFNGEQVSNHYESDISLVLHPLPRLPLLICYWKPDEEGHPSELNLFLDRTASRNLDAEWIYQLATGMVIMFGKIAQKHDPAA